MNIFGELIIATHLEREARTKPHGLGRDPWGGQPGFIWGFQ